jgi:hypothetical protein
MAYAFGDAGIKARDDPDEGHQAEREDGRTQPGLVLSSDIKERA